MEQYEATEAFIEVLNANGVEFIFYNPGYDVAPIIGTLNRYRRMGRHTPRPILCLDESVALAAAHGNYLVSGRQQVVLVHSELGTQQVGGAMHQAQWGRVPVVLCAGLRGPVQRKNWLGEPFDQGYIVRNCVKWDHLLSSKENLHDILRQALKIASSEPCGPVYFCFDREDILKKIDRETILPARKDVETSTPPVDVDALKKAAEILIEAENPLILTGHSGRHFRSVDTLIELAGTLCSRVSTAPVRMNFPSSHPLCAGIDPNDGISNVNPYLPLADVLLVIDYDLSYAPPRIVPGPQCKIIHIDTDFMKQGGPLWGREAEIRLVGDSGEVIPALNDIIRQSLTPEAHSRLNARFKRLEREHGELRSNWHSLAMNAAGQTPISPHWLCHCINEVVDNDTIIVDQTITSSLSVSQQIERNKPGTLIACAGGSIGWALPAALGAKLAAPDNLVVSLMGDGAFIYGCPVATLWTASNHRAPFLSIIFNNQAYGAVKGGLRILFGEDNEGADISPPPDYASVARACNAYGNRIEDPNDVLPALKEAIKRVRNGRSAVLDVRLNPA